MAYDLQPLPTTPIGYTCPEDYILESKKFEKGGQWFLDYSRWISRNFYNQARISFTNAPRTNYMGIADEAIENWSYVFGEQVNSIFAYETTDMQGNIVPAIWIPGAKITELFDYLKGKIIEDISNIKIKSTNLSKYAADYKNKLLEKLNAQHELKGLLAQVEGIKFDPTNEDLSFESRDDILKYIDKWQDKYAIMAERIAKNEVYMDRLDDKFCSSGINTITGGVTGMLTEIINGRRVNTPIPTHEIIWDNRTDDDYNTDAKLCGYVKNRISFTDILRFYGDKLSKPDIEDIRALAVSSTKNLNNYMYHYNTTPNLQWYTNPGTSDMTLSVSKQWWIAPRDWRWRKETNSFGKDRPRKIDDSREYKTDAGKVKGSDLAGDFWGWDIYTATVIGNRWLIDYGYADNVIRPHGRKEYPQLPMRTFCHGMSLGFGKPMVSKLKKHQNEVDRLEFKKQQLTARDLGMFHIINGNTLDATSIELLSDAKMHGLHVRKGTNGEAADPNDQNVERVVESVDMRLDPNIDKYVMLQEVQLREMEKIVSVSDISLGQQQTIVGKGVQENTINQNSYGTASLYYGLMKHYEKILQYNVNLAQLIYSTTSSVEETLQIGDEGSYLLKILDTQEFGTQHLGVFIEIEDALDSQSKERIKSLALAAAQNDKIDVIDYLEYIELSDSKNEMVEGLKYSKKKKEQADIQAQQQQIDAETQSQMALGQQNADLQIALKQFTEDNANYRNNVTNETKLLAQDQKMMMEEQKMLVEKMDKIVEFIQLIGQQTPPPLAAQLQPPQQQEQPIEQAPGAPV